MELTLIDQAAPLSPVRCIHGTVPLTQYNCIIEHVTTVIVGHHFKLLKGNTEGLLHQQNGSSADEEQIATDGPFSYHLEDSH